MYDVALLTEDGQAQVINLSTVQGGEVASCVCCVAQGNVSVSSFCMYNVGLCTIA